MAAWSTISAPPLPVTVGKPWITATMRTGTGVGPADSRTVPPIAVLLALRNALVAMPGMADAGKHAVRVSCPDTGSGGYPGFWIRSPAPRPKVNIPGPPAAARQEA